MTSPNKGTKKQKIREGAQQPTAKQLAEGLIISVGEARKLLGAEYESLTDDEVALVILALSDVAPVLLKNKPTL